MKTLYLIRHSQPEKNTDLPTEKIPLSLIGHRKAEQLFSNCIFSHVSHVYSSPFLRAFQTAEKLRKPILIDERLQERALGNPDTSDESFWLHQYTDHDFRNEGGESMNETGKRMEAALSDILVSIADGDTAAVITHAAAICAYLMKYCTVEVTDVQLKKRRITFRNKVILDGIIDTPSVFVLRFENDILHDIFYKDITGMNR